MTRAALTGLALLATIGGGAPLLARAAAPLPLVVVDAGHGGTNVGAFGPATRVFEKQLTLAVARAVAARLRGGGLARVVLTRTADRYLTLQQRVAHANRLDAAAFVSLHFNASPARTRDGFEVYALSRAAADLEAQRLALRAGERAAAERGAAAAARADVSGILVDLAQRAQLEASTRLAHGVRQALRELRGKQRDRGVKQAAFDVLMGLRMPAVLVELGFIDHPVEGPELSRPELHEQLAAAIVAALERFLQAPAR